MRELGKHMQTITDGISREDWALVAKVAPLIADHPQPPLGERMRVLALVGSDVSTFRDLDEKTHQAAKMLEHDAMRDDGNRVITDFGRLQSSCFACHQSFRKSFTDHF
ncbi:MAG: cytochrome C [Deltaproteobacteria bacterium]|nr:cytochrome C [Deltaproteobacteria bacterium]